MYIRETTNTNSHDEQSLRGPPLACNLAESSSALRDFLGVSSSATDAANLSKPARRGSDSNLRLSALRVRIRGKNVGLHSGAV